MAPVLELRGITKSFPGVLANDQIDLQLEEGEVLALLGENGAGKSTLMNILYGLYTPDEGEIFIRGQKVDIDNPNDAIGRGIGMVHQHFMLVPVLTVTENVMLGNETLRNGVFLDQSKAAKRIREISEQYMLDVDPSAYIKDLPVGVQQRVEIIKLLYREADILILDEPTAVLTPQEIEELFKIIRTLLDRGKSIIFITHKLGEVMEIADKIAVLRMGRMVGTALPGDISEKELASMMVGREVVLSVDKPPANPREKVLEVCDLFATDDRGNKALNGVSFDVSAGEILGIAGVQGNGQTELVQVLTGLRNPESGEFFIDNKEMTGASPRKILDEGVAHVPEDRQADGLVLAFPIADNMILNTYAKEPFTRGLTMQEKVIDETARRLVQEFDVRTPGVMIPVGNLSGGNQQKVIVAREFSRPIQLLIAAQPTRGLDVGSIEYIHKRIIEKRDDGTAVLLVSTELDEIISLSDRIAVMFKGQILDILPGDQVTREELGLLMAGVVKEEK